MKRDKGYLYYIADDSHHAKTVRIPMVFVFILSALLLSGSVGLINILQFGASYAHASLSHFTQVRQNQQLTLKLRFLGKLTEQKHREMEVLARFEDHARLKYGMNPITPDVRLAGVGGKPSIEEEIALVLEDAHLKQASTLRHRIENMVRQMQLQDSTFSRLAHHVVRQNDRWAQRPSIWPVRGKLTSGYGYRYHPLHGATLFHEGIDIAAPVWTPIFATASGMVSTVGYKGDYGLLVAIHHDNGGLITRYAHLVQSAVEEGQVVNRGEIIGYVGSTGRSTGPHLHYEVLEMGRIRDPQQYILPTDYVVD